MDVVQAHERVDIDTLIAIARFMIEMFLPQPISYLKVQRFAWLRGDNKWYKCTSKPH